jgi:hypothetical protein
LLRLLLAPALLAVALLRLLLAVALFMLKSHDQISSLPITKRWILPERGNWATHRL